MARNTARNLIPNSSTNVLAAAAIALAEAGLIVNRQAAKAEKASPPRGAFVSVDGVRLHYIERGEGRPVVFLHGNGMMAEDMLVSGVLDVAAGKSFRAIAFDRPGFGYSDRPRGTSWTAAAQAALLVQAFSQMEIERPIGLVLDAGLIACAQAVEHYEMARYGALSAWAEQLDLADAVTLLDETLDEEKAADEKLFDIAEDVNAEADSDDQDDGDVVKSKPEKAASKAWRSPLFLVHGA